MKTTKMHVLKHVTIDVYVFQHLKMSFLSIAYVQCRYIEPTILVDPPLDAEIMTEEIFGPLLPIITV